MFQSNKAQTSIEFIILVAILLLIGFYFIGSIYKTFDSNYAIYTIKNKTLQLFSENDSEDVLSKISYELQNSDITLRLNITQQDPSGHIISESDYTKEINDILNRTTFQNVHIIINWV